MNRKYLNYAEEVSVFIDRMLDIYKGLSENIVIKNHGDAPSEEHSLALDLEMGIRYLSRFVKAIKE